MSQVPWYIATGKSTSLLKVCGYPMIDVDVRENKLPSDRCLEREKPGRVIFGGESRREQLDGIVHPAVRKAMT